MYLGFFKGLLLLTVVAGQRLTLVEEPQSVEVNERQEVVLNCKFSGPAKECVWSKDGEITIVREPYHYINDPNIGDCSIRIQQVSLTRDDGFWQCQYPRDGDHPAVTSQGAKITVLVAPDEPTIYFNGDRIEKGGTLAFDASNENVTLICMSQKGNPAAALYWMIDNRRWDGSHVNKSIQETGNLKLFNSENQLTLIGGSDLRGSQIKCIAEHPSYKEVLHESYGYVEVHHNTTQVTAFVDDSFNTKLTVDKNVEVTLYCSADGVPAPTYMWQFQRNGEKTWEILGNQQNLTIQALAGTYVCLAGNSYNIEQLRSLEDIKVETKDAESQVNSSGKITFHSLCILISVLLGRLGTW